MKIDTPKFGTKKELFSYLTSMKREIVDLKKAEFKKCDPLVLNDEPVVTSKALFTAKAEDNDLEIQRTIVGNTYNWLDSHEDVHVENCFSVSLAQRKNRVNHLHDHIQQLSARVGKFQDVYEKEIAWKELGVDKEGSTIMLAGDSAIKRVLNATIFEAYKAGEIDQHSVGMIYVDINLAVNDSEYKTEYATWLKYAPLLGNPEKAEELGYFWAVREAKLVEISCVLQGSNSLTPTLGPAKATQAVDIKTDPAETSRKRLIYY